LRGNVLNAADESADALAPGQLVTILGRNFGDGAAIAFPHSGSFPFELSNTRVLFNNMAAPMIFASGAAVSAVVPFGLIPNTRTDVVVEYLGQRSPPVSIFVASSAPGLFTTNGSGRGPARVLNLDSTTGALTLNTPQNPAPRGGTIVAYITGAGQTDPPLADGVVTADPAGIVLPVEAGFLVVGGSGPCQSPGCSPVQVLSARTAPNNIAGITEVRMRLPSQTPTGNRTLGISVGGIWTQFNATVSIR
jgi:uncharacterized protein (TIGR03437 family)